ncbi:MAG: hypothetical protein ACREQE_01510, partial [Candidatus Binataceae bacterium]
MPGGIVALGAALLAFAGYLAASTTQPNDPIASHVFGQIDLSNSAPNFVDAQGLDRPSAIALDDAGHIFVADSGNNRVLGWKSFDSFIGGNAADLVIGQADVYSYRCNPGLPAPNATTLCDPEGLVVDGKDNLYVADTGNNRVLLFAAPY